MSFNVGDCVFYYYTEDEMNRMRYGNDRRASKVARIVAIERRLIVELSNGNRETVAELHARPAEEAKFVERKRLYLSGIIEKATLELQKLENP